MAGKEEILNQIKRIAEQRCDHKLNQCTRRTCRRNPCPGARSIITAVETASSAAEMERQVNALSCAQSMFGHLFAEECLNGE